MNKGKLIVIVFLVISVSLFVLFIRKNRWYSQTDIASHKDAVSCWTSINGNVYDVTLLANTHTGGSKAILQVCGKDGSVVFNKRHGDSQDIESELSCPILPNTNS